VFGVGPLVDGVRTNTIFAGSSAGASQGRTEFSKRDNFRVQAGYASPMALQCSM